MSRWSSYGGSGIFNYWVPELESAPESLPTTNQRPAISRRQGVGSAVSAPSATPPQLNSGGVVTVLPK